VARPTYSCVDEDPVLARFTQVAPKLCGMFGMPFRFALAQAVLAAIVGFIIGKVLEVATSIPFVWSTTVGIVCGLLAFALLLLYWPRLANRWHGDGTVTDPRRRVFAKTRGGSFTMRGSKVSGKDTDFDQQDTKTHIQDSEFE
jgi:hypothetical protein